MSLELLRRYITILIILEAQSPINKISIVPVSRSDNKTADKTCWMFSSSADEAVGEQNVGVTDEKFCHNGLYADVLQGSQTALLLLQIFAPVGRHLEKSLYDCC